VVKSRLGPNRDTQNTIEAQQRAKSVDNNRDNHSHHHDDRGRGRRHDSDNDRERSWSPSQRGPRAFGQNIHDAMFPSHFWAPTNVPRYDGDTNPRVWLEDYRLACHAGGATDDLFVIKNLPLYLDDSAPHVARALAVRQDQRLDRPALSLHWHIPGHVHTPR
jgi:hypothetical protein